MIQLTILTRALILVCQRAKDKAQKTLSTTRCRKRVRHATQRGLTVLLAVLASIGITTPAVAATTVAGEKSTRFQTGGGGSGVVDGLGDAVYNALLSATDVLAKVILLPVALTLQWIQAMLVTPVPPEAPGFGVSPGTTGVGPGAQLFTGSLGGVQEFFYQLSFIVISLYAVWYIIALGLGKYPGADKGRILLMFVVAIGGVSVSQYLIGLVLEFLNVWTTVILPTDTYSFTSGIFRNSFITVEQTAEVWVEEGVPAGIGAGIAGTLENAGRLALFYTFGLLIFSLVALIIGLALVFFLGARLISVYALYAAAPIFIVVYVFKTGPARVFVGPADRFISTTTSLVLAVIPMSIVFRIGIELAAAISAENLGGAEIAFALIALAAGLWAGIKTSSTSARVANTLKTAAVVAGAAVTAGAVGASASGVIRAGAYKGMSGAGIAAAGKTGQKLGDKFSEEGIPNPFNSSANTGSTSSDNAADENDVGSNTEETDSDVIDLDDDEYNENPDDVIDEDEQSVSPFGPDDSRSVSDSVDNSRSGVTSMTSSVSFSSSQPDGIGEMELAPADGENIVGLDDEDEELDTDVISLGEDQDEVGEDSDEQMVATPVNEDTLNELDEEQGLYASRDDGTVNEAMPDTELPTGEEGSVRIGYDPDTGRVLLRSNPAETTDIRESLNRIGVTGRDIDSVSDDTLSIDPEIWTDRSDDIYEQLWTVGGKEVGVESSAIGRLTEPAPLETERRGGQAAAASGTLIDSRRLQQRDLETAKRRAVANNNTELQTRIDNIRAESSTNTQYLLETDDMPTDLADTVTPTSAVQSQELGGVLLTDNELETTVDNIAERDIDVAATSTLTDRFEQLSASETQTVQANVGRVGDLTTASSDERIEVRTAPTGGVREIVATEDADLTDAVNIQQTKSIEPVGELTPEDRFERIQQDEPLTAETQTKDTVTVDVTEIPQSKQGQIRRILTEDIDGAEPVQATSNPDLKNIDLEGKPGVSADDVGKPFAFEIEQGDIDTVAQLLEVRGVDYDLDGFASQHIDLPQEPMAKKQVEVPDTEDAVMRFVSDGSQGVYATAASDAREDTLTAGLNPTTGSLTIEAMGDGVSTEEFIDIVGANVSDETIDAIKNGTQLPAVEIEQRDLAQDTIQRAINSVGVDIDPDDARTLGLANRQTESTETYQAQLTDIFPRGVTSTEEENSEAVISVDGQNGVPEVRVESRQNMDNSYDVGLVEQDGQINVAIPDTESEDVMKALGRDLFKGAPTTAETAGDETVITAELDTDRRNDALDEVITRATQRDHVVKATESAYERAGKDINKLQTQVSISDEDTVAVEFGNNATPQIKTIEKSMAPEELATIDYVNDDRRDELEIQLRSEEDVQAVKQAIAKRTEDTRDIDTSTSFGKSGTPTVRTSAYPEEVLDALREENVDTTLDTDVFESMGGVTEVSQTAATHDSDVSPHRADGWMLDPDR